jgi:hypothetical protein
MGDPIAIASVGGAVCKHGPLSVVVNANADALRMICADSKEDIDVMNLDKCSDVDVFKHNKTYIMKECNKLTCLELLLIAVVQAVVGWFCVLIAALACAVVQTMREGIKRNE